MKLRDFVRDKATGAVYLIVYNDRQGGVLRGHVEVWAGYCDERGPILIQKCVDDLELVEAPRAFERDGAAADNAGGMNP